MPRPTPFTPAERDHAFFSKVEPCPTTGCWLWMGSTKGKGYAGFTAGLPHGRMSFAHRWSYERLLGPIPEGLSLDHLCRVPICVNPGHLEAVPHRENCLRGASPFARNAKKTHCKRGHPLAGDNVLRRSNGNRDCGICRRTRDKARYARRVAK